MRPLLMALRSFPRARGDVPNFGGFSVDQALFSPRTRGCSYGPRAADPRAGVFPAHAGMFLIAAGDAAKAAGFPRARGDVPR